MPNQSNADIWSGALQETVEWVFASQETLTKLTRSTRDHYCNCIFPIPLPWKTCKKSCLFTLLYINSFIFVPTNLAFLSVPCSVNNYIPLFVRKNSTRFVTVSLTLSPRKLLSWRAWTYRDIELNRRCWTNVIDKPEIKTSRFVSGGVGVDCWCHVFRLNVAACSHMSLQLQKVEVSSAHVSLLEWHWGAVYSNWLHAGAWCISGYCRCFPSP